MSARVAVVRIDSDYYTAMMKALDLIGGIEELNVPEREVVIKVGLFDPRYEHHTCTAALDAIITAFDCSSRIYLAESDNYCAKALDRLERFRSLFSDKVLPFSLSEDPVMERHTIAGEEMDLSHVLMKPNVLISTHVLRTFGSGSILKNLFGCTPMVKKAKYHNTALFSNLLADIYEAAGGIDLAVLDGTFLYHNCSGTRVPVNLLVVGRDAVAVEIVGAMLAGLNSEKLRCLPEFISRGLGETSLEKIEIVGISEADLVRSKMAAKELKKLLKLQPRMPGISDTIDRLVEEGWMDTQRSVVDVLEALQELGVKNPSKSVVDTTLKRRLGKTLERSKVEGTWLFTRKAG